MKAKRKRKAKEIQSSDLCLEKDVMDKWTETKVVTNELISFKEYETIMTDTNNMSARQLAFHEKMCAKIRAKWDMK